MQLAATQSKCPSCGSRQTTVLRTTMAPTTLGTPTRKCMAYVPNEDGIGSTLREVEVPQDNPQEEPCIQRECEECKNRWIQ